MFSRAWHCLSIFGALNLDWSVGLLLCYDWSDAMTFSFVFTTVNIDNQNNKELQLWKEMIRACCRCCEVSNNLPSHKANQRQY